MLQLKTQEELIDFLKNFKSSKRVTMVTKTEVALNKKDVDTKTIPSPWAKKPLYKVSILEGEINFDYEDRVNDQLLIEGKKPGFQAAEAVWGQSLSKSLDFHNEMYYLKVIPEANLVDPTYEEADGTKVLKEEFKAFVPKSNSTSRQGTKEEVPYRKYKLSSIIHFKIPGIVEYTAP